MRTLDPALPRPPPPHNCYQLYCHFIMQKRYITPKHSEAASVYFIVQLSKFPYDFLTSLHVVVQQLQSIMTKARGSRRRRVRHDSRKTEMHILNHKQGADRINWQWCKTSNPQSPTLASYIFPLARPHPLSHPNRIIIWGVSIQMPRTMGDILKRAQAVINFIIFVIVCVYVCACMCNM